MNAPERKPKRGRPPLTFITSSGTTKSLAELGSTRQQRSDWMAMASLPKDVFAAALLDPNHKPTTRRLVNMARNLPPDHRRGDPLTDAVRSALRLSSVERRALGLAIYSADEAASLYAELSRLDGGRR